MTEPRTVGIVLVVLVLGGGVSALPAAGDIQPAESVQDPTAATALGSSGVNQISVADARNRSAAFDRAWTEFTAANESIHSISETLPTAASDLNTSANYERDADSIRAISGNVATMDRAAADATKALVNSDLTPAQQSMLLAEIEAKRAGAKGTATDTISQYQDAVATSRASAESTVTLYFGGTLAGGLVLGAIVGAIIPFREAKNVEEQLKLSRNVSYNRRAGLVPVVGGLLLCIVGVGALVLVGAGGLIGVFV